VDGLLFINLAEGEWADMGITNRFHIRKLQLILTQYKARYERKKDKIRRGDLDLEEDEDEIGTEYSPSELSDIIRQEGMSESESEPDERQVRLPSPPSLSHRDPYSTKRAMTMTTKRTRTSMR
jgi:hypothetical protein